MPGSQETKIGGRLAAGEDPGNHALIDALPAAVYMTDASGRITHFNQACVAFSGRTPQLGSDEWCVTWKLYYPDGTPMPHSECPMAIALREGREVRGAEAIAERPDGKRVWFEPYPTPLFDGSGNVIGGINMLVDITERKHADLLLRSEKRALELFTQGASLRDILEFLVGTVEAHSEHRLAASLALLNETQTHFDQSIGPKLPVSYHSAVEGMPVSSDTGSCCRAVLTRLPVIIRDVASDPQWSRFAEFIGPLGYRAAWSALITGSDGKVLGTFAVYSQHPEEPSGVDQQFVQGITRTVGLVIERARSEELLRDSERRYRQLANLLPVAVYTCDAGGMITYHNEQAAQLWGRAPAPSDTDERFCGSEQMILPNGQVLPHDQCPMAIALREGASFRNEAVDIRRPDGTQISVQVNIDPIKDKVGRVIGAVNVFHDVTTLRRTEEARQLLVAELNHRVKNTLASVQAIAHHTMRRTQDPKEFVSSFSGRIQSLSRVHALLSATTWQSADLSELVLDQLSSGAADETRIVFAGPRLQLQPQLALHLAMILHELGTNAVKYGALSTPSGRVSLRWTVENRTLRLWWQERGGPAVVVPTKRGFGMTLIEQSAQGEGGNARMVLEGDGIDWEVDLPLPQMTPAEHAVQSAMRFASASGGQEARSAQGTSGNLAGRRFLIVEDEPLVALDLADNLLGAGVEVVASVGSCKDALAIIEQRRLDAALLDGNLHGQSVEEVASALTRHNVPFLFVTGYGRESLPRAFQDVALVNKPFTPPQLLEAAATLFERRADVIRLRKSSDQASRRSNPS